MAFSNNGATLGGFLCLVYLGDEGLVVSGLFSLLAVPYYFTVVFTVARRFSAEKNIGIWTAFKYNLRDPVSILPLAAMFVGLSLGVSAIAIPPVFIAPRRYLVYAVVMLFSISFGLSANVTVLLRRFREYLAIVPVKFLVAPIVGLTVALLFGLGLSSNPIGFKVIVIQSAMPVAIWSVVATKLFRLDDQLAFGLWLFTTLCVVPLLPVVSWFARL